jgi:beta-phosphoglucomutase-like phosphatase (HAD superfamily)
MDGVLIDARDWHYDALNEALRIFGVEINRSDHLSRFNGLSTRKKLDMLTSDGLVPYELHEAIQSIKQDRTLRIAAQKCFPIVSHQVLINRLKVLGIKVGLVTNSIRKSSEFMLEYAGLLKFMDVVVTNEDVLEGKPNPAGYLLAMQKLQVLPSETIVIEDGEYGILAAEAAGASVIKVSDPFEVSLELLLPIIKELR